MNKIRQIEQLNKRELEAGITPEGSWHVDYRDTVRNPLPKNFIFCARS